MEERLQKYLAECGVASRRKCEELIRDGKVKVKIEPGTQPGKVLRIRGKGLPSVNGYGIGDLLVNISIYVPETLSKDEKKALEKMEDSDNFKPNTSIKEKIFRKFKSLFD